jgi:phosphoadenosine phosphosulfate reductase
LKRALKNVDIWITGLRASQSVTRTNMPIVEWDENFKVIKLNPLINWSEVTLCFFRIKIFDINFV